MNLDLDQLTMPAISKTGLKILSMLSGNHFDVAKLSETISQDLILTATLIRYANSPMYRSRVEVMNIRNAISLLGLNNVRMAVVVVSMRSWRTGVKTPLVESTWQHCQTISTLSKLIALKAVPRVANDVQLTGLMHDLCVCVLTTTFPDTPLDTLEPSHFVAVSQHCIKTFRLPEDVGQAIVDYHNGCLLSDIDVPSNAHLAIISMAHYVAQQAIQPPQNRPETPANARQNLMTLLNLQEDDLGHIAQQFGELATV